MAGVAKPDELKGHIRLAVTGDWNSRSYVRGALRYLEQKPPNPFVVPILKKVLEKSNACI